MIRKFQNSGKIDPIKNPIIKENDEPKAVNWIASWLNQRRPQLDENMQGLDNPKIPHGFSFGDLKNGYSSGRTKTNKA